MNRLRARRIARRMKHNAPPAPTAEQCDWLLLVETQALIAEHPQCVEMWGGTCPLEPCDEGGPCDYHVCCEDHPHAGPHVCPCGATHG